MTPRTARLNHHGTVTPAWLALREPADAAARAADLVGMVRGRLEPGTPLAVHDLGSGTGSMARWLAPRLPGPQQWVLYDQDPDLLMIAAATGPSLAADNGPVTTNTRRRDVTRLDSRELAGASLVTASALLDMLTLEEVNRVVDACLAAGCPALLTMSVTGRVTLLPADPLDDAIAAAFNNHQRRSTGGRRLLGPDAVAAAADRFSRHGSDVVLRPSPWVLDSDQAALCAEWFTGWLAAAVEQRPSLAAPAHAYASRRLAAASAGGLRVTVEHVDLLAGAR